MVREGSDLWRTGTRSRCVMAQTVVEGHLDEATKGRFSDYTKDFVMGLIIDQGVSLTCSLSFSAA